jgi:hypothetical protein
MQYTHYSLIVEYEKLESCSLTGEKPNEEAVIALLILKTSLTSA